MYFTCDKCDYITCKKFDYRKHLTTAKHLGKINDNNKSQKVAMCGNGYICSCGQIYKFNSGLSRHKRKCRFQDDDDIVCDKGLVIKLINQNNELQTQVIELLKSGTHTHNTNINNKTFNLNFFLNETCKDAMNIMDFVKTIQLQLSDLEKMGEIGYVNGISEIIVKNLKDMDINIRPIHCMDVKREILYIKDSDKWDKEENGNPKVRNVIKHIAHKNSKLLNEYKVLNPNYNNSSSKVSDKYNKLLIESMGGKGDNDFEKENKIIRNITKEIIIERKK